tara:strand:- start:159 stop:1112 length:954 start_codon:yes stop_codon:yes gene_type:complete
MKKFLITGGYGLLGISLVKLLLKKKAKVVILDYKKSNKSDLFFKKNKNLKIENGNFINIKSLIRIFKKHNFDGIFHLGAQTQVLRAYQDPYHTHQTNVLGTLNLLEIIRIKKLKIPLIYSSSDKAYGELQKKYYYEDDKLNASYPYDASKSASDIICQSYSKTYNIKLGIIRSANIFGECDFNVGRIVPETIISALKNKKLKIRSSGKQKRDYLYVEDVSRAYYKVFLELKKKKKKLLIYNTGSKYNLTALQLIKKIYKILEVKENYVIMNSSKAEIQNQRLNYTKIKKELGWEPKFSLGLSLKKTISWYKLNINLF